MSFRAGFRPHSDTNSTILILFELQAFVGCIWCVKWGDRLFMEKTLDFERFSVACDGKGDRRPVLRPQRRLPKRTFVYAKILCII